MDWMDRFFLGGVLFFLLFGFGLVRGVMNDGMG